MPVNDDVGEIEFDLIDEEADAEDTLNDVFARDTAIPAPSAQLSEEMMRPEGGKAPNSQPKSRNNPRVPPPPPMRSQQLTPITLQPPSEDLEFDSFDPPIDVFAQSGVDTHPPQHGQSEMPTAPPMAARGLLEQAKRSSPAPMGRAQRPAFMTETARNSPADAELLVRATLPGTNTVTAGLDFSNSTEPGTKDSALDFVDSFEPMLDSLAPMAGLDVPEPAPSQSRAGPAEMQECYAVGDFSRALSIAEQILARTPDDVSVRRCAQSCRDVLTQMFAARIGPLDQIISVVVSPDEVQWLALDHRAGFLLSLVDGQSTVDEILDISGMTRLDALKIIFDLTERQVVRLA